MLKQALPHTAAATWSGFIYQGRIALYHILKLLNTKTELELADLFVQIDSIEDFAIIQYNAAGLIIPLTMHQVKAVKSSLYSTYVADFDQLEKKKLNSSVNSVMAYFHLSTKNEETKANIQLKHPNLEIYCYEKNEEFCPLNEINDKIKNNIKIVLQNRSIAGYDNHNNIEVIFDIIDKKISDRVLYIHSLNHNGVAIRDAAYGNPICLIEFLNEIVQDLSVLVQDEKYFEAKIKSNLNRYYQEYCIEIDDDDLSEEIKIKMNNYMSFFNSLDSKNFKLFLQNIRPHKVIKYNDLTDYTDHSLQEEEIKYALLTILKEIKTTNNKKYIGWICSEFKNYFPTSITISNSDASKKRISDWIIKTALDSSVEVPFNSDFLVTSECNVDNLEAYVNKINNIEIEERNKITSWKNVGLIDLETAKKKLND